MENGSVTCPWLWASEGAIATNSAFGEGGSITAGRGWYLLKKQHGGKGLNTPTSVQFRALDGCSVKVTPRAKLDNDLLDVASNLSLRRHSLSPNRTTERWAAIWKAFRTDTVRVLSLPPQKKIQLGCFIYLCHYCCLYSCIPALSPAFLVPALQLLLLILSTVHCTALHLSCAMFPPTLALCLSMTRKATLSKLPQPCSSPDLNLPLPATAIQQTKTQRSKHRLIPCSKSLQFGPEMKQVFHSLVLDNKITTIRTWFHSLLKLCIFFYSSSSPFYLYAHVFSKLTTYFQLIISLVSVLCISLCHYYQNLSLFSYLQHR